MARDGLGHDKTRERGRLILPVIAIAGALASVAVVAHDNSGMFEFLRGEADHAARPDNPSRQPLTIHRRAVGEYADLGSRAVCVRLCDGAFFPVGDVGNLVGEESLCAGLCPNAPTRMYLIPRGADKIDTARSSDGRLYSELPVAYRYTKTYDETCTCRRKDQHEATLVALMNDFTLRRGDVVMTNGGPVVFDGAPRLPHTMGDFVELTKAKDRVSKDNLAELTALQGLQKTEVSAGR